MTRLRPIARLTYSAAFVLPFLWAASGNAVPMFDERQTQTIMTTYGEELVKSDVIPETDISALADLDGNPAVTTDEERAMQALLTKLFVSSPVQP